MKIIIFILCLILTPISFGSEVIKGNIHKDFIIELAADSEFLDTYQQPFPNPHYKVHLAIARTDNLIVLKSGQKILKDDYNTIDSTARLDLVTYDKSTGYFKYRLSIQVKKLFHGSSRPSDAGPISIDGKLFFDVNHMPEILIEGNVSFINGQPILTNINSNNSGFSLAYGTLLPDVLLLTTSHNIPVSIIIN